MFKLGICVIVCLALVDLGSQCDPPDCERRDCGTCANACCNLQFFLRNFINLNFDFYFFSFTSFKMLNLKN